MLAANSTLIGKLRFRMDRRPAPRLVSTASRCVKTADLRPPGLPPSATLIIRRLQDTLPCGTLPPKRFAIANGKWEMAMRQRISALLASAARPSLRVPLPDSEAVVFADEAEMLACLALDMGRGSAARNWWWRDLLRRLPVPLTLEHLLLSNCRLIPEIVKEIHRTGRAMPVLLMLSSEAARHVAEAMSTVFEVSGTLIAAIRQTSVLEAAQGFASAPPSQAGRALTDQPARAHWNTSPFKRWVPQPESESAPLIHTVFLAEAIGLGREPAVVRSPLFGVRALEWIAHLSAAPGEPTRSAARGPASAPASTRSTAERSRKQPLRFTSASADQSSGDPVFVDERREPEPGSAQPLDSAPSATPPDGRRALSPGGLAPSDTASEFTQQAVQGQPSVQIAPRTPATDLEGIRTSFGGVFFLIHVLDRLGIPDCIPWGRHMSCWAWLELIARRLLAETSEPPSDPIWTALRELDGRDGPWPHATVPEHFDLPERWKELHPAGISLGQNGSLRHQGLESALSAWLDGALPYVVMWLMRQLQAASVDDAVRTLLVFPAKVFVTRVSIDVIASLNGTRVSVRRAGLDLDPGWRPDYGRIVQFHYESL